MKILLVIAAAIAIGLASVSSRPELFKPVMDWAAIEGSIFSNLFQMAVTALPELFKSAIDWAAIPLLKLTSIFGIVYPKEVAAGITACLTVLIAILVKQAPFTKFTKIAFRNIPRRKLRNGLTILAILLGVALVIGVNIAFDNVYAQFERTIVVAVGNVDINVRPGLDEPFDQSVLALVRETDDVADASGRVSGQVVVLRLDGGWELATVIGVDSSSDFSYLDPDIRITRKLPFIKFPIQLKVNGTDAVVDEGLNYTIGDLITVYAITNLNLTNQLDQTKQFDPTKLIFFNVAGIYHPSGVTRYYGGHTIYIDLVKAQEIFDCKGKLNNIIVKVADIKQPDRVVNDLNSKLGPNYVINPVKKGLSSTIKKATSGLESGLQIMSVMALCVAIIIVLNTMYMNVGERTYEIGILRSTGASTWQIFWIFFSESLILGFTGAAIGLVTGIMLTDVFHYLTLRMFQSFSPTLAFRVSAAPRQMQYLALGAGAGILTAVTGGLFPSLAACRTDVIKALRPAMRGAGKPRTALKLIVIGLPLTIFGSFIYAGYTFFEQFGLGLLIASLLAPFPVAGVVLLAAGLLRSASPVVEHSLILFGKTRKIISRNIERNLRRSTICFALIGISLSFVVLIGGAQDGVVMGVKDVIRSFSSTDLTVISQTSSPRSFADNLTAIDGGNLISCTAPNLIVPQRTTLVNNMSIPSTKSLSTIMAIDPTTYSKVISMRFSEDTPSNALTKLDTPGKIILTAPLARSLNATVGDTIEMLVAPNNDSPTPTWMNFTVVGIAEGAWMEMMSIGGFSLTETCYVSYESLNRSFPKHNNTANLFFVKAKSNQNIDHIKHRIMESYESDFKLSVITYNDIMERVKDSINEIFVILYSIVMFAVVNAAIGVAAIMVMNVAERHREIGIMRSQGMSKFQVVASIIGEATVLGVVGFAVGTVLGLIFHRITVSYMRLEGFPMPYFIPFDHIGLSLVLAVLTSIISAVYPAYRASKLNVVDALRR